MKAKGTFVNSLLWERECIAIRAELTQVKTLMEDLIPAAISTTRFLKEQRQKTEKAQRKALRTTTTASAVTPPAKDRDGLSQDVTGTITYPAHTGMAEHIQTSTHCLLSTHMLQQPIHSPNERLKVSAAMDLLRGGTTQLNQLRAPPF